MTRHAGITDVGRRRANNEDAWMGSDYARCWVVSDGMGGHEAGEVASQIAVTTVLAYALAHPAETSRDPGLVASRSVRAANAAVCAEGARRRKSIGATVVVLVRGSSRVAVAHAGDSRCYLLREGTIYPLTRDHADPIHKHVVTRALGFPTGDQPDVVLVEPHPGDRFLLCTDGLTNMVGDDQILRIGAAASPSSFGRALVEAANRAGGVDNITAVVVQF